MAQISILDKALELEREVKRLKAINEEAARTYAQTVSQRNELDAKLKAMVPHLDAAVEVCVFVRDNKYPEFGSPEFARFSDFLDKLATELRKLKLL